MDEGYEEIQLRLSYSDVEGQLQKNPTGALAKMAKKHEADLAVCSGNSGLMTDSQMHRLAIAFPRKRLCAIVIPPRLPLVRVQRH